MSVAKLSAAFILIVEGVVLAFFFPLSYVQPAIIAIGVLVIAGDVATWLRERMKKRDDTV